MKNEFGNIPELLRERLAVIADHAFRDRDPAAHLLKLREVSEALASEHARLRHALPARLNHFMTQASYAKAAAFIDENRAAE